MRVIAHQSIPRSAVLVIWRTLLRGRPFGALLVSLFLTGILIAQYATSIEPVPVTPEQRENALKRVISINTGTHIRKREIHHGVVFDDLPDSLDSDITKSAMASRKPIPLYTHNPIDGPEDAPVTLIEMTDLSCRSCMDVVRAVDNIQRQFGDEVRVVHKYLPIDIYTPTNTAAFFGKIAQKEGMFWEYRQRLLSLDVIEENTFNDQLIKMGIPLSDIQKTIRRDARQFYRELDADALLAKQLGETVPPALYVNGIKVGAGAVPMAALEDLVKYELSKERAPLPGAAPKKGVHE